MMAAGLKIAFIQNEFSESGMDKPLLIDRQTGQVFDNFLELAEGLLLIAFSAACLLKSFLQDVSVAPLRMTLSTL